MKVKIQITTNGADAIYLITYKGSKFQKLEHQRGKIREDQFKALMGIIPPVIEELETYQTKYPKVIYEKVLETKSLFKTLLDQYHNWYLEQTEIAPRIDGTTGNHLKKIITYLQKQTTDEEEIKTIFLLIFEKWSTLPDFYRNQRELRKINSNLNII